MARPRGANYGKTATGAPSVSVTTKVELDGDFFTKGPAKTVRENIRDMLEALSGEMESQVKSEIGGHQGAMPRSVGWSRDHTVGYVTSGKTGKRWHLWAAVGAVTAGMDKKNAIRTKAAAAGIERRWHPYRRVKSGVYRARAVVSADLSKGL